VDKIGCVGDTGTVNSRRRVAAYCSFFCGFQVALLHVVGPLLRGTMESPLIVYPRPHRFGRSVTRRMSVSMSCDTGTYQRPDSEYAASAWHWHCHWQTVPVLLLLILPVAGHWQCQCQSQWAIMAGTVADLVVVLLRAPSRHFPRCIHSHWQACFELLTRTAVCQCRSLRLTHCPSGRCQPECHRASDRCKWSES
jgi:hypothetical protein